MAGFITTPYRVVDFWVQSLPQVHPSNIKKIQLDGDELDLITKTAKRLIPVEDREQRVVNWTGQDAQRVYLHLQRVIKPA